MKVFKRCYAVLKHTGAIHIFIAYLFVMCISALVVMIGEPDINSLGDALWYCFVASTTVGFGDMYAVTVLGRIMTVLVTVSGIITVAMVPGVVLSYYLEFVKIQEKETVSRFMEKLENLPGLSDEELKELSKRVKELKKKIK